MVILKAAYGRGEAEGYIGFQLIVAFVLAVPSGGHKGRQQHGGNQSRFSGKVLDIVGYSVLVEINAFLVFPVFILP